MTARFLITGRVQGVGFRWFVLKEARALGLRGFVRNLDDGGVDVLVTGEAEAIERLATALARGPAGARVTNVQRTDTSDGVEGEQFEVR